MNILSYEVSTKRGQGQFSLSSLTFGVLHLALLAWWRGRYDELNPDDVDTEITRLERFSDDWSIRIVRSVIGSVSDIDDNPPKNEDERRSRLSPWRLSDVPTAEASSLLDQLKASVARPSDGALGDAWTEMVEIESTLSTQITVMLLGGRPEAWWYKEVADRLGGDDSWTFQWPDRAKLVHRATNLIESVTP